MHGLHKPTVDGTTNRLSGWRDRRRTAAADADVRKVVGDLNSTESDIAAAKAELRRAEVGEQVVFPSTLAPFGGFPMQQQAQTRSTDIKGRLAMLRARQEALQDAMADAMVGPDDVPDVEAPRI